MSEEEKLLNQEQQQVPEETQQEETVEVNDELPEENAESAESSSEEAKGETAEEDDPLPESGDDKATWPKGVADRIKREKAKAAKKDAEIAALREQLIKASAQPSSVPAINQAAQAGQAPQDSQMPRRENFNDDADFVRAVIKHDAEVHQQKIQQEALVKAEMEFRNKFNDALASGAESYGDFDEKVEVLFQPDFPPNRAMAEAIVDSPYKNDIFYYLGTYPDKAREIAKLNPIQAVKKIAELEARYAAKKKANISKAPAPLKPLNSAQGGASDVGTESVSKIEKMSAEDFSRWYNDKYRRAA